MPHLDEARLVEFLDEGSDAPERWRDVRDHLAGCEECRARLAEVRAIEERAREILSASGPAELTIPPFADVLRRAGRGPAQRRARVLRGLAWAATVVLAVGVGWYARDYANGSRQSTVDAVAPSNALVAVAESSVPSPQAAAGPARTVQRPDADRFTENEAAAALASGAIAQGDPGAGGAEPVSRAGNRPAPAEAFRAAEPEAQVADERVALAQDQAPAPAAAPAAPAAAPAPEAREPDLGRAAALADAAEARARREAPVDTAWTTVSRDTAIELLGAVPWTLDGVEPTTYAARRDGRPEIRTTHTVAPDLTVFLNQARGDEQDEENRVAVQRRADAGVVSVIREGIRVAIEGPLPPDSLRALLARLTR